MIKNLIAAFIVIALAALLTAGLNSYFKTNKGDFFVLEKGQPIPDFTVITIEGDQYSLSDFKGRPVIIHFWASWCAPCVVEFPELIALAKKRPNIVILGLSSDKTEAAIDRFFSRHNFKVPDNFKIVHDAQGDITQGKFSVFQLPESFIVNPDGTLESHIVGAYTGWKDLHLPTP